MNFRDLGLLGSVMGGGEEPAPAPQPDTPPTFEDLYGAYMNRGLGQAGFYGKLLQLMGRQPELFGSLADRDEFAARIFPIVQRQMGEY